MSSFKSEDLPPSGLLKLNPKCRNINLSRGAFQLFLSVDLVFSQPFPVLPFIRSEFNR